MFIENETAFANADLLNLFLAPLGVAAPRCRHLMIETKDKDGNTYNQPSVSFQPRSCTDSNLVEMFRKKYAARGQRLCAVCDMAAGEALYIRDGYPEEIGMSLQDMLANLKACTCRW